MLTQDSAGVRRACSPTPYNDDAVRAVNSAWAPHGFARVNGAYHRVYREVPPPPHGAFPLPSR